MGIICSTNRCIAPRSEYFQLVFLDLQYQARLLLKDVDTPLIQLKIAQEMSILAAERSSTIFGFIKHMGHTRYDVDSFRRMKKFANFDSYSEKKPSPETCCASSVEVMEDTTASHCHSHSENTVCGNGDGCSPVLNVQYSTEISGCAAPVGVVVEDQSLAHQLFDKPSHWTPVGNDAIKGLPSDGYIECAGFSTDGRVFAHNLFAKLPDWNPDGNATSDGCENENEGPVLDGDAGLDEDLMADYDNSLDLLGYHCDREQTGYEDSVIGDNAFFDDAGLVVYDNDLFFRGCYPQDDVVDNDLMIVYDNCLFLRGCHSQEIVDDEWKIVFDNDVFLDSHPQENLHPDDYVLDADLINDCLQVTSCIDIDSINLVRCDALCKGDPLLDGALHHNNGGIYLKKVVAGGYCTSLSQKVFTPSLIFNCIPFTVGDTLFTWDIALTCMAVRSHEIPAIRDERVNGIVTILFESCGNYSMEDKMLVVQVTIDLLSESSSLSVLGLFDILFKGPDAYLLTVGRDYLDKLLGLFLVPEFDVNSGVCPVLGELGSQVIVDDYHVLGVQITLDGCGDSLPHVNQDGLCRGVIYAMPLMGCDGICKVNNFSVNDKVVIISSLQFVAQDIFGGVAGLGQSTVYMKAVPFGFTILVTCNSCTAPICSHDMELPRAAGLLTGTVFNGFSYPVKVSTSFLVSLTLIIGSQSPFILDDSGGLWYPFHDPLMCCRICFPTVCWSMPEWLFWVAGRHNAWVCPYFCMMIDYDRVSLGSGPYAFYGLLSRQDCLWLAPILLPSGNMVCSIDRFSVQWISDFGFMAGCHIWWNLVRVFSHREHFWLFSVSWDMASLDVRFTQIEKKLVQRSIDTWLGLVPHVASYCVMLPIETCLGLVPHVASYCVMLLYLWKPPWHFQVRSIFGFHNHDLVMKQIHCQLLYDSYFYSLEGGGLPVLNVNWRNSCWVSLLHFFLVPLFGCGVYISLDKFGSIIACQNWADDGLLLQFFVLDEDGLQLYVGLFWAIVATVCGWKCPVDWDSSGFPRPCGAKYGCLQWVNWVNTLLGRLTKASGDDVGHDVQDMKIEPYLGISWITSYAVEPKSTKVCSPRSKRSRGKMRFFIFGLVVVFFL